MEKKEIKKNIMNIFKKKSKINYPMTMKEVKDGIRSVPRDRFYDIFKVLVEKGKIRKRVLGKHAVCYYLSEVVKGIRFVEHSRHSKELITSSW